MPLALTASVEIAGRYDKTPGLEAPVSQLAITLASMFADGSGAGQASVFYSASRTLAASASESLDLNGTALLDVFGQALALTKIKGLIIQARAANTTDLTVGNVTNGLATILGIATQSFTLQPGEILAKITNSNAGYVVTPATGDLLRVANAAGASATYDIIIIGA
jgi:hypothetical protein